VLVALDVNDTPRPATVHQGTRRTAAAAAATAASADVFVAGHDTTASLVGWTMWYLMNHPEVESKLVAEVLGVMGPDTQPSYQQLSEMRYLNAVLKVRNSLFSSVS
jgi:cytochrome P450